jgi:hypothetical protein
LLANLTVLKVAADLDLHWSENEDNVVISVEVPAF